MTPADIVAEALAHAEDAVPQSIGRRHDSYVIVNEDRDIDDSGWGLTMMAHEQHVSTRKPRVVYVRHDAMLAALAHVAERLAEAEERATRLSAALDQVVEMTQGDMDLFDRAYGVAHNAQRACGACFGKKDKVAAHG